MENSPDPVLDDLLKTLPQLDQVQYDTTTQLSYLYQIAVKLGLYDAASILRDTYKV
jgi:hypothetical protein